MQLKANFTGFKYLNTIQTDNGIINGIVIISEGVSKNDGYYDKEFLSRLVELGNQNELGVPSRLGHPSQVESKPVGFIGRYKNFRLQDGSPAKVLADLHLDDITKSIDFSSKLSIWDYVLQLSETAPDSFGNSINYYYDPNSVVYVDENGEQVEEGTYGFEKPTDLLSFDFSDLVDVPAATTSLFENSNNNNMFNKKQEAEIKKLKAELSKYRKALDLDLTLADGTAINVVQDTPEPAPIGEGNQVQLSDGNPVPDGPHILADGRIIETEGGEIINIEAPVEEPVEEDVDPTPESEDENEDTSDIGKRLQDIADQFKNYQESTNKTIAGLVKRFNSTQLSKQPSGGVPSKTSVNEATTSVGIDSLRERIRNKRNNKK